MLQSLAAHGPNGSSLLASDRIALGHRLLKVTAEDELEAQPLAAHSHSTPDTDTTHDATIWLVADARVDNRAQLAVEFALSASEAAGMADSAFVLRAWQRWGQDCVEHLVGSFAFAVWDARVEEFFLARDHAGDRPLYYRKTAESFIFATTARAIRTCPGVSSELDERQLARDLIGLPPEFPRTRFRDVQALAPGHCLTVGRDGAMHRRYWQIDSLTEVRFARDEEYVEAFREIFDEAVRCRLRTTGGVATELSAGLDSVALRVPSHPVATALLQALDRPIAAPSANASGRITTTSAPHVAAELGEKVDLILDGGATPLGLESTVIGFDCEQATLLRPGAIAREEIEAITGPLGAPGDPIRSPGQLESHYAPDARLRLNAARAEAGEALLGFGKVTDTWLNLSPRGDLKEAAANLFSMLRDMDGQVNAIAVSPIPETGLGEAINDRLRRAAHR